MILVFTVVLAIFMELLLYGLDKNYCLSIDELERLTMNTGGVELGEVCGINAGCETG